MIFGPVLRRVGLLALVCSVGAELGVAQDSARDSSLERPPVLSFPDPSLDDTAAYQGYRTRFYRDSKGNTVQIYLQPQTSRVVLVWADAANESAGFSARDAAGRPVRLEWASFDATVSDSGAARSIEYRVRAPVSEIRLGWFVLGSMRVERDFVYAKRYLAPFSAPLFTVAEESLLVAAAASLPASEQRRHLALLNASSLDELRRRLTPAMTSARGDTSSVIRVERPSLDGRNYLGLELRVDTRKARAEISGHTVTLRTRPGAALSFAVRVITDAGPLTPLQRDQIFNPQFLEFLSRGGSARDTTSPTYRRLERQVRGVELLSSEEKLMAGLPNFATYFGRDMMMTALMMRPIWSPEMSEHVIASVLRKLGPMGDVSHEEALAGQAIREHATIYDSLIGRYHWARQHRRATAAAAALEQARAALRDLQKTRENYHMIDDEFQLPLVAARYLADSAPSADRKRRFLLDQSDSGPPRLRLLLRELGLVTRKTRAYAENPRAANLVGFPKRDATHWRSASWRDSDAGYAGGRFAMDVNAVWVPHALESIGSILASLAELGFTPDSLIAIAPEIARGPLLRYVRNAKLLDRAVETWKTARRHFVVSLSPRQIESAVSSKLAWLTPEERTYWRGLMEKQNEPGDSLSFLALSLDSAGRPIRVVNTDPATELFLNRAGSAEEMSRLIAPIFRPYPVGLFVEKLGPLVANDAYASRSVWERFKDDHYHGPRVVWGREVNLLLLGLATHRSSGLEEQLSRLLDAVNASGLQHNELWSYEINNGRLTPIRYGTSSDVQLWNTTNLVVQYVLSQAPR